MSSHRNPALESAVAELVRVLGGHRVGNGAMCRCPAHEDSTPSLSVRLGDTSLLFKCFAGCDTIDVLRAIRRRRLAVPAGERSEGTTPPFGDAHMAHRAADIWHEAGPLPASLGQRYLASRAITRTSSELRYHPRTPLGRGRLVRHRPAIIAAIRQHGRLLAIQRLFLSSNPLGLAGDLARPKLTLGRPLGGAVALDPAEPVLGLAEGIETALSASILLGMPVWATLGNERLARIALPPVVRKLILLADADRPGRLAAYDAAATYAATGIEIETLWPWHGLNDWNDVLRQQRGGGGDPVRLAA